MYERGWQAFPNVRERSGVPPEWSEGPPGCPRVVGKTTQMTGSGRKSLPSGLEALPDVREWSGAPPR